MSGRVVEIRYTPTDLPGFRWSAWTFRSDGRPAACKFRPTRRSAERARRRFLASTAYRMDAAA